MTPVFINPKIDYAFKIIFGREENKPLLISFLNAMIYEGEPTITAVEILNPYLPSAVETHKDTYVDIQAMLDDGSIVLIEMQMSRTRAFFKRVLFNTAKRYSSHLIEGESYTNLVPVISLIVANFVYNEAQTRLLTRFKLQEVVEQFPYPAADDFQIVVAELPKFKKTLAEANGLIDEWLFFLQHASVLQEVPQMIRTKEVLRAFDVAKRINLTQLELDNLERRKLDALAAEQELEMTAQESWELGREEGIDIGREEGIDIGREEGRLQAMQDMIANILLLRFGDVSQTAVGDIHKIRDLSVLSELTALVATCETVAGFQERLTTVLYG